MKKLFLALLLIPTFYVTATCHRCTENSTAETEETAHLIWKRYVEAEQVALYSNKILVRVDQDRIIETSAVYRDESGFYIYDDDECDERTGYRWRCVICNYCNAFWDKCCLRCNRDRKGDKCKK